jgi:hypothetical protein
MKDGVHIEVESEDIAIATTTLEWQDKERHLFTGEADRVDITRSDGTSFTGWGFSADARRRSWEFKNGAEGTYIEEDDDEEEANEAADRPDADTAAEPSAPVVTGTDADSSAEAALPVPAKTTEVEEEDVEKKYMENLSAVLEGAK